LPVDEEFCSINRDPGTPPRLSTTFSQVSGERRSRHSSQM